MKKQQVESATSSSISMVESSEAPELKQLPKQLASDMEFVFGFNVSTSQIIDLFSSVVDEMKFDLIELEQTHATAIKHGKKSFFQVIDCFNWWTEGAITAIKMTIVTREKDSKRVCRVRGLVGSKRQVVQFISKFKAKSSQLSSSRLMFQDEDEIQMGQQQTNPFYLQSCAAYMFHKILSNQKYGIGSLLHSSINNFNGEYQDAKNSAPLLPLPMKKAITIVEEVVSNLYKDFNYGRHQMQQIMPYCRISVQKYVFEKIYVTLSSVYISKNEVTVKNYTNKKRKIMSEYSTLAIFKQIGLSQKFWLTSPQDPQLNKPGEIANSKAGKCYKKACRQFEKILLTQSPREKVKHTQITFTTLKTLIYEQTPDHQQLFNMEDIIPLLILTLLLTDINEIKNQLDFMVDFIGFDPCDLQAERRLLVNLSESFNYIYRDWKIEG